MMIINNIPFFANKSVTPHIQTEAAKPKDLELLSDEKKISPFDAFCKGAEEAIAGYLKQEGIVTQRLFYGPQNITKETLQTKEVLSSLLKNYDSVKFISQNEEIFVQFADKKYNLNQILKKVNFNHISFSDHELAVYGKWMHSEKILHKPAPFYDDHIQNEEFFIRRDPEGSCADLHLAEKQAINIYTGSSHSAMNALLRGNIQQAVSRNYALPSYLSKEQKLNITLKEILLHAAVAVSGLNKLPDYDPPAGPDGRKSKFLYRGEGPEMFSIRKEAVADGGRVTMETGFISTSYDHPSSYFFSNYTTCGVLLYNVKGKKITALSQFGDYEREVLIPPTQVQWLHLREVKAPNGNTVHLFLARPVTVPIERPTINAPKRNNQEFPVQDR